MVLLVPLDLVDVVPVASPSYQDGDSSEQDRGKARHRAPLCGVFPLGWGGSAPPTVSGLVEAHKALTVLVSQVNQSLNRSYKNIIRQRATCAD